MNLLKAAPVEVEIVGYLFEMSYIRLSLDSFLKFLSPLMICVGRCLDALSANPQTQADEKLIISLNHLAYYLDNMPCMEGEDAWNRFSSTLTDQEWVIYQRLRNRPKNQAERMQFSFDDLTLALDSMPRISFSTALDDFLEGIGTAIDMLRSVAEGFNSIPMFAPLPKWFESSIAYAIAGYPYGKNHRGRKKWMKKQARG